MSKQHRPITVVKLMIVLVQARVIMGSDRIANITELSQIFELMNITFKLLGIKQTDEYYKLDKLFQFLFVCILFQFLGSIH